MGPLASCLVLLAATVLVLAPLPGAAVRLRPWATVSSTRVGFEHDSDSSLGAELNDSDLDESVTDEVEEGESSSSEDDADGTESFLDLSVLPDAMRKRKQSVGGNPKSGSRKQNNNPKSGLRRQNSKPKSGSRNRNGQPKSGSRKPNSRSVGARPSNGPQPGRPGKRGAGTSGKPPKKSKLNQSNRGTRASPTRGSGAPGAQATPSAQASQSPDLIRQAKDGLDLMKTAKKKLIDPAVKAVTNVRKAAEMAKNGGKLIEKPLDAVAKAADYAPKGPLEKAKDFVGNQKDRLSAVVGVVKFGEAVASGDREKIVTSGASAAGDLMKAANIKGGEFVTASGELINAADKFSRGDAAGGSVALGKGAEAMLKAGLEKTGPLGTAVSATISAVEGGMEVANKVLPGLNARTSVGEVAGEAGFAISQRGLGQFGRDLASGLATDARANSDNAIVRTTGQVAQAVGKTMQAVDQTVQQAGQTASQIVQIGGAVVQQVGQQVGQAAQQVGQAVQQGVDRAACLAQASVPCQICAPWDGYCRDHMFDCRTKCD